MQINTVCGIFCIKNLQNESNHKTLIDQYYECIEPIRTAKKNAQYSELKRMSKTYSRSLIQLSNSLQTELKINTKRISQVVLNKSRRTLIQIAFLTDQCLVKLQYILKMKRWSIERMWNGFLCRAVAWKFWDLVDSECNIFLHHLDELNSESFSNQEMSEYVQLLTSNMYNKSRALIEISFKKHYKESVQCLQKSIKICSKHTDIEWKITYLDRVFRVMNKIASDYAAANKKSSHDTTHENFTLRLQALYCLLVKHRLTNQRNHCKENQHKQKTASSKKDTTDVISFWNIAHQYIRYIKQKYTETDLIKFRKMMIEIWIQHQSAPANDQYSIDFLNLCVDYIISIGECPAKLKIDILTKIMQQLYTYIDHIKHKMEFKIICNIVNSVAISQMALKHDIEYVTHSLHSWQNTHSLLQTHHHLLAECKDDEIWKLFSKSIRNIPYVTRYIEDSYSFQSDSCAMDQHVVDVAKSIVSNVEQLFNIWCCCSEDMISKQKLKNVNHRLFDTLITVLSIEQKVFMKCNKLLSTKDIVKLLKTTKHHITNHTSDTQLFQSFATKGYNIAVQIYNTCSDYEEVIHIAEIVQSSCQIYEDTELLAKCDKIYESALFKCDNSQIVFYKIARNIATYLQMSNNLQSDDITECYKYLKLLVKYQTHSKNRHKLKNTPSMSLIDMLENIGVDTQTLNEKLVIQLLTEQLRLYQSSFSYNTTIQQIEILETLLKDYLCAQRPIQRAIALIDLAKLIRISKPSATEHANTLTPKKQTNAALDEKSEDLDQLFTSTLNIEDIDSSDGEIHVSEAPVEGYEPCLDLQYEERDPLHLLEEAIDLLTEVKHSEVDDDEVEFEMIIDDVLASGYLWKGIVKRELYATQQVLTSQVDVLSTSMLNLSLVPNDDNKDDHDESGFESMLQAMDLWSNVITKQCKSKCKHVANVADDKKNRECTECHKCFRDLFATIQHLQIMVDYMHLNHLIPKEIFLLDRMIRLLSTMSHHLDWCREYRLLCLCWSAIAYYKFGNISESQKIFVELEPVLLKTTPDISIHVQQHIRIIYAKYQAMTQQKQGIQTLLTLKKEIEHNKINSGLFQWEDVYLLAKIKSVLAEIEIDSPQVHNINTAHMVDMDPSVLAKDSLIRFTTLIDRINERFMFKQDLSEHQRVVKHSTTYNGFIDALPHKKYQFLEAASKQYLAVHHPQSTIHQSHTKMLYHYPSEFRLIAEFLKCIDILGRTLSIVHQPKMSSYHFENGRKAAHHLVVHPQTRLFLVRLAKTESKKTDWEKYEQHVSSWDDVSLLSSVKLSPSLTRRIYGSLSKHTPYAVDYDSNMMHILSLECIADSLRYKEKYKEAMEEYQKCISIVTSFFEAKPAKPNKKYPRGKGKDTNHHDFAPILKVKCSIQRKYALCLLHLKEPNVLRQCLSICFEILSHKEILSDLLIAKTKLCIGQCLILQIQCTKIMQTIWRGNAETDELHTILQANMMNKQVVNNIDNCNIEMDIGYLDRYDPNAIAIVLCCRQNLIQCLLILLHLKTVDPELIKKTCFALSYIYGMTNIKWSAMFLNMAQSVNTRQNAIQQYSKQLNIIKEQWHDFKVAHKKHSKEVRVSRESSADHNGDVSIRDLEKSMKKLKLNKKNKKNRFDPNDYLDYNEYSCLYSSFYHKVTNMRYIHSDEEISIDYNDCNLCCKVMDMICNKFYGQTVEYLQYSWNCLSMEVDDLLQTMLISVVHPSSTSRNVPMEIVIVDIPLDRSRNGERKDEEDTAHDDSFLNQLYFDRNTENGQEQNKYSQVMNEFDAFFKEANESTHSGKECNSKNEVKTWWDNRYKLDKRLKHNLEQIETHILGLFRCLFVPHFRHKQSKKLLHSSCDALVTAINDYLLKKTKNKYKATCYSQPNKDKSAQQRSPKMILFQQLLQLMLIGHEEEAVYDDEIKHGISYIFGVNDSYLLNKLLDTVKQHITTIHKKFASKLNMQDFDPLVMCIGDALSHLPWENIPILKTCVPSICRIPCLEFAALRVLEYNKYKNERDKGLNCYYIVNPKGDLKKTEGRFNRLLNEEWCGIKGEIPTTDQFRDGLEENDVFLYVGHNGGEEFVSCWKLQTFNIKAITFLMGCSSGLLKKRGMYQSNGIANYYMIGSCPIVVANLWDVTDKDIDQFSAQMLRKCVLKQQGIIDIPKAVNMSRSVCKLKYLNGAAPICYGIPFHLFNGIYV